MQFWIPNLNFPNVLRVKLRREKHYQNSTSGDYFQLTETSLTSVCSEWMNINTPGSQQHLTN